MGGNLEAIWEVTWRLSSLTIFKSVQFCEPWCFCGGVQESLGEVQDGHWGQRWHVKPLGRSGSDLWALHMCTFWEDWLYLTHCYLFGTLHSAPTWIFLLIKEMNEYKTMYGAVNTDSGPDSLWMGSLTLGKSHHFSRLQFPCGYQ